MKNEIIAIYYVGGYAKVVANFLEHYIKNIEIIFVAHELTFDTTVPVKLFENFVDENPLKDILVVIPSDWSFQDISNLCQQSGYNNLVGYAKYLMPKLLPIIDNNTMLSNGKKVAIYLPETAVYRKHYTDLPRLLEKKGFSVVLFSNKALGDDFEKRHPFVQIKHPFLIYFFSFHFDVLISDNCLLPSFSEELLNTKKVYLPHGWIGLAERMVDAQIPLNEIKNSLELSLFNVFDYLFMPNKQTFDFFSQVHSTLKCESKLMLIPGGYNSLDLANQEKINSENTNALPSILYSPGALPSGNTHESIDISFPFHSENIIKALLATFPKHQIIFRPHPASLNDPDIACSVARLVKRFESNRLFLYDQNKSHKSSFDKAVIMVSDSSTSAYTYGFSQLKPVIFFLPNGKQKLSLSIGNKSFNSLRYDVGIIVTNIEELIRQTSNALADTSMFRDKALDIREREFFNFGHVMEYFTSHMHDIIDDNYVKDWLCLENGRD